jgi:glycosyltransferase involved in cell wall biosynthesis
MKILLVHPHEVFSMLEPWTTRVVNFAREFTLMGHEVKVVYFPLDWDHSSHLPFERFGVQFIPFCRKAGFRIIMRNCAAMSRVASWADVVHFQKCFHYASLPSLVAGLSGDKPVHYDWDDWEEMIYYESAVPPVPGIGSFLRTLERTIPQLVETVSVSSDRLMRVCLEVGVKSGDIFHVPVGADTELFKPGNGQDMKKRHGIRLPLVIYVGQLHGGQYVELFLKAAAAVTDRGVKAQFMVVGDGVRAAELKDRAKELGLQRKVIFTGAVPSAEVPGYICSSDVAVACFEDNEVTRCKSPLKIAEYLACGKPIVASRVGEVSNMVGDAGFLVEPGKHLPLAEKIAVLLKNAPLRESMGKKARKRAEDTYNWRSSSRTLLNAYNHAAAKRRRR